MTLSDNAMTRQPLNGIKPVPISLSDWQDAEQGSLNGVGRNGREQEEEKVPLVKCQFWKQNAESYLNIMQKKNYFTQYCKKTKNQQPSLFIFEKCLNLSIFYMYWRNKFFFGERYFKLCYLPFQKQFALVINEVKLVLACDRARFCHLHYSAFNPMTNVEPFIKALTI